MARAFYSSLFFDTGSNPVGDLMERESGFTLEDLLDVDEVLQEAKGMNRKLLDFLCTPETLAAMVRYVTVAAPAEAASRTKYKHPYMCAEVFCCDIPELNAALVDSESPALACLFAILDTTAPIDCALAGYFCKIVMLLARQKRVSLLAFLTVGGDALLAKFVAHIGSHSIAEALKCTLSIAGPADAAANGGGAKEGEAEENAASAVVWGVSKAIVDGLTAVLHPHRTADEHRNVSEVLMSLLRPPQFGDRSALLTHMLEDGWCDELLRRALDDEAALTEGDGDAPAGAGGVGSTRACALRVVLQLVETTCSDAAQEEDMPSDIGKAPAMPVCVSALATRWQPQLLACLERARRTMRHMQNGEIIVGAGQLRVLVAKIVAVVTRVVVASDAEACAAAIAQGGCLQKCVVMIFDFPHNNILHGIIVDIVDAVLACDAPAFGGPGEAVLGALQRAVFGGKGEGGGACLLDDLVEAMRDETLAESAKVGGASAHGNSAHLHQIATLVLKAVERATERGDSTPVVDAVERNVQWEATVHGPIVGHYAAERTFFCDVTPPSKDPVHRDDDAASAEPAVLTAAVAAASAAKAAAIKEARGADAERQYDDVVDNTSEDVIAGMLREAQMALHLPAAFGGKDADAANDDDEWDAFDAGRSLGTGGDDDDDDDFGFGSLTLNMGEADSAALDDDFDPFS